MFLDCLTVAPGKEKKRFFFIFNPSSQSWSVISRRNFKSDESVPCRFLLAPYKGNQSLLQAWVFFPSWTWASQSQPYTVMKLQWAVSKPEGAEVDQHMVMMRQGHQTSCHKEFYRYTWVER